MKTAHITLQFLIICIISLYACSDSSYSVQINNLAPQSATTYDLNNYIDRLR